MIREILQYPDPRLRERAKPVEKVDAEIRRILKDMTETMYAMEGVGLAATQLGINLRLATIDITNCEGDLGLGLVKIVNPEIIKHDGQIKWNEGCLSVPGLKQMMKRHKHITVKFLDENGEEKILEVEGLFAVAVQQEIDHLDGKLIIDSASALKQDLYRKKLKKSEK